MGQPIPVQFGPESDFGKFGLDGTKRVFNAYAVPIAGGGKGDVALYAAPGLRPFVICGAGPFRGGIVVNDVAYVAVGQALYAVDRLGSVTTLGGVPGNGLVSAAANALADPDILFSAAGRVYHVKTGQFSTLETDTLPPVVDIDFIRGRFICAIADGRFYYSDINTVTFNGASFYNAEGKPDGLTGVWCRRNEVWLLGTETVEVYVPTENSDDPFSPLGGGALPYGCVSAASIAQNNDDIFWVDQSFKVRKAQGYNPQEISPPWLSRLIEAEPDKAALFAGIYAIDGRQFYDLSGTNFTARYNLETGTWTERETTGLPRWRGQGALTLGSMTLVGDYQSGALYTLDKDYAYDGDQKIMLRLRSPILHAFPMPLSIYSLHVDVISGARDDGSDPELAEPSITLRMSDDGKSFDGPLREPLWRDGESGRVIWRQLGTYERSGASAEITAWAGVCKAVMSAVINGADGST